MPAALPSFALGAAARTDKRDSGAPRLLGLRRGPRRREGRRGAREPERCEHRAHEGGVHGAVAGPPHQTAQAAELLGDAVLDALAARLRRHLTPGAVRDPSEVVELGDAGPR
jgi:hypothetical protein